MHLLPTQNIGLETTDQAVDLDLPPGDVVVLSFADSDLAALAAVADEAPFSMRLASLRRLRHPLSVDLFLDKTAAQARFVLVRCLGGLDYWRYGIERLASLARSRGIAFAVIPGCERPDPRLAAYGTVEVAAAERMLGYFLAGGGPDNMRRLLTAISDVLAGHGDAGPSPTPMPALLGIGGDGRIVPAADVWIDRADPRPLVPILIYRSSVAAGDLAAARTLSDALAMRGLAPAIIGVSSLKDPAVLDGLHALVSRHRPAAIVTTTAFSARDGEGFPLDLANCPIVQAIPVGQPRDAWAASPRGLSGADLAMQVALPEFDGRIGTIPIAFKRETADPLTGATVRRFEPDPDGIAALGDLVAGWVALARTQPPDRRLALVLSDYPARGGRAGFAVGLDTPESVRAIRDLLADAGYAAGDAVDPAELMRTLTEGPFGWTVPLAQYASWLSSLPEGARQDLIAAHGPVEDDPAVADGAFRFRAVRLGNLIVALQPGRDGSDDRKASYHDGERPPSHGYLAFYLGLRSLERIHALIHLGTHGTLEWLPGKAVALSAACWPRLALGALPVIYPYIVDDPGEAAPAKRRIGAVTIGHIPPPLERAGIAGRVGTLRERVEEFASAQVMDPRRAALVARDILDEAETLGLLAACGVSRDMPAAQALAALDAHLCDFAEMAFRDGLHVFGRAPHDEASAAGEREGLLRALDGRFVRPGPSGSPHRGRHDVLPTGRNLTTMDPRAIPTRAAMELGRRAAEAVITRHLQDEGDYPRSVVLDLWASPTLRTGGEDIGHALALLGCEPTFEPATGRVTGFRVLPPALLDRPRVDVILRVSGAFRDTFPHQIALLDAACRAVAALDEEDGTNPLAAARRAGEPLARVFGAAPGRFGAGAARLALDGDWADRQALADAYLAASNHAFGGAEGEAIGSDGFRPLAARACAFVHATDTPGRDILEATSAADTIGGFAASAPGARIYSLDTSDPGMPKVRGLVEDLSRIVHGRLAHPAWIAGQMRHGWRGAAELAEGVDALFVFAATSEGVPAQLFDALYEAYLADQTVCEALATANPAALAAIRSRLDEARRRGLWTSRRNAPLLEAAE